MENGELRIYLLNDEKYEGVENYPVIEFSPLVTSINFSEIDFLIFTSKNAVKITNSITDKWKKIPSIAIGEATAKIIKNLGGKVELISSGYGEELAIDIDKNYKNKTFLWLRPQKISTELKYYVKFNVLKEKIIYKTQCKEKKEKLKKPAIVIFTSPSTIKCFAQINNFENIISIAIGRKTKEILKEYTSNIILSPTPSIKECIKLAQTL